MKIKTLFICFALMLTFASQCRAEYNASAIKAYNMGIDQTNQEKYKEAAVSFENAVYISPDFTDAHYNLGIIYQQLNQPDKALNAFNAVLKYNPNDYEVINKVAVLYHKKGKYQEALTFIQKIPADNSNYKSAQELLHIIQDEQTKLAKLQEEQNALNYETFAELDGPTGMVKDSKGILYIANYSNNSIVSVDKTGKRQVIAQGGIINGPLGLAVDKNDNIYVANYESNQIVVLSAEDRAPQVLPFIVKKPYFLMIDEYNKLYVSEQGSNVVSQHNINNN